MAATCTYKFGEFSSEEFFDPNDPESGEFFLGYKDCSESWMELDCNKVLIFPRPYTPTEREIDYNKLYDYSEKALLDSYNQYNNLLKIGEVENCLILFNFQNKWLIEYLLLFKEQLSLDPTIDNYKKLFIDYKLECINKQWKCNYRKNTWILDMLKLLGIDALVSDIYLYQYNTNLDLIPSYYPYKPNA